MRLLSWRLSYAPLVGVAVLPGNEDDRTSHVQHRVVQSISGAPKGCTLPMGFTPRFFPAMVYVVFDGSSTICFECCFQILRTLSIKICMTIPDARIRLTVALLVFSVFEIVIFVLCWHPTVAKCIH